MKELTEGQKLNHVGHKLPENVFINVTKVTEITKPYHGNHTTIKLIGKIGRDETEFELVFPREVSNFIKNEL